MRSERSFPPPFTGEVSSKTAEGGGSRPLAAVFAATLFIFGVPAHAAELKILATGSMAEPLKELGEAFTHETGNTLAFSLGTTGVVMNKIKGGEKADVIVISVEAADTLQEQGKIVAATRAVVASSLFGVAVK